MKVGLMLGGGGAKGSYQIGLLEVLEKYKIINEIKLISGASIGTINGYFYLGGDSKSLKEAWTYGIENSPMSNKPNFKDKGLFSMDVLKQIEKNFFDKEKFQNCHKDLYMITTEIKSPSLISIIKKSNWVERVFHLNSVDEPINYVISSASIPIIFGANELDDKFFIDGGLTNNNPIDVLIEKGAKLIFVSPLEKPIDYQKIKDKDVTIVELTPNSMFPHGALEQLKSIVGFDLNELEEKVEYGKYVAEEMLKECVIEGVLKFKNGQYIINEINKGFKVVKIPSYVESTVLNMINVNHLKRKEKEDGNN